MTARLRFHGQGTLLWVDIVVAQAPPEGLSSTEKQRLFAVNQQHVRAIVEEEGGQLVQKTGDALCACWMQPAPEHARKAMACARRLRRQPMPSTGEHAFRYELDLALGSGELLGNEFGPIRQFQVVGSGAAAARRVVEAGRWRGDLRLCGMTADLLGDEITATLKDEIERTGLPPFRIFALEPEA
jgi:class 3 adenylate cyclase